MGRAENDLGDRYHWEGGGQQEGMGMLEKSVLTSFRLAFGALGGGILLGPCDLLHRKKEMPYVLDHVLDREVKLAQGLADSATRETAVTPHLSDSCPDGTLPVTLPLPRTAKTRDIASNIFRDSSTTF